MINSAVVCLVTGVRVEWKGSEVPDQPDGGAGTCSGHGLDETHRWGGGVGVGKEFALWSGCLSVSGAKVQLTVCTAHGLLQL